MGRSTSALPGPSSLSTGVVDDTALEFGTNDALGDARVTQAGASFVRIDIIWWDVAPARPSATFNPRNPADPNYQWQTVDRAVRAASAAHLNVVLDVGHAPPWAEGSHRPRSAAAGSWRIRPRALGAFAHAAALRYSGHFHDAASDGVLPRVKYFEAWNEPNSAVFLTPQWSRGRHGIAPASPGIYRGMLNAFYAGVKSAARGDYVISAGTAPYGRPAGQGLLAPALFYRELFCVSPKFRAQPCPSKVHFDALDHHPYAISPTYHAQLPDDISIADLGKIWKILHAAQRANHVAPAGPKALWVTEMNWASQPETPAKLAAQAGKTARALYELWSENVSHAFWYLLTDPDGADIHFAGGGLYDVAGQPKPVVSAFRFPFVVVHRVGARATIWGRSPLPGEVTIVRQSGSAPQTLLRLRTDESGIFDERTTVPRDATLVASAGGFTSYPSSTG